MKYSLIALLFISSLANATTYYVDGTNGDDLNDGTSLVANTDTLLFSAFFENGDFSQFYNTLATGTGNSTEVTDTDAYAGSYSYKMTAGGADGLAYISEKDTLSSATAVNFKTYIKFDSGFSMTDGDLFNLIVLYAENDSTARVQVRVKYTTASSYELYSLISDDVSATQYTPTVSIGTSLVDGEWHSLEVRFSAGTGADGEVSLLVDGSVISQRTDLDIDTRRIGGLNVLGSSNLDAGTTGSIYFDNITWSEVDDVNTAGPWETVVHAAEYTSDKGDTVNIRAGTYASSLQIEFSRDNATIQPYQSEVVTLSSSYAGTSFIIGQSVTSVTISGLTMIKAANTGNALQIGGANATIISNRIYFDTGVTGDDVIKVTGLPVVTGVTIENNELYNSIDQCVDLISGGEHVVRGNILHDCQNALVAKLGIDDVLIENNISYNQTFEHFLIGGSSASGVPGFPDFTHQATDVVARNNMAYGSDQECIIFDGAANSSATNNTCYGGGYMLQREEKELGEGEWLYTVNATVKNNVVYNSAIGPYHFKIETDNDTGLAVDHNAYFESGTPVTSFRIFDVGYTWANYRLAQPTWDVDSTWTEASPDLSAAPAFVPDWDSPLIDGGTHVAGSTAGCTSTCTDINGNPIYGLPDVGAVEYQPPYVAGTNAVSTAGVRVYGDGKFRNTATPTDYVPLTVDPTSDDTADYLDVEVTAWTPASKAWTESSTTIVDPVEHQIAGLAPGRDYSVFVDDVLGTDISGDDCTTGVCTADAYGAVSFTYSGTYSDHDFEVTPVSSVIGLVDTDSGAEVDADSRYIQPAPVDDKCYAIRNQAWIEVTCP